MPKSLSTCSISKTTQQMLMEFCTGILHGKLACKFYLGIYWSIITYTFRYATFHVIRHGFLIATTWTKSQGSLCGICVDRTPLGRLFS